MLATLAWLPARVQDAALRLRLLSTTDIHAHIVDDDDYRDQRWLVESLGGAAVWRVSQTAASLVSRMEPRRIANRRSCVASVLNEPSTCLV